MFFEVRIVITGAMVGGDQNQTGGKASGVLIVFLWVFFTWKYGVGLKIHQAVPFSERSTVCANSGRD